MRASYKYRVTTGLVILVHVHLGRLAIGEPAQFSIKYQRVRLRVTNSKLREP